MIALIAVTLFSLIGLYLAMAAATDVRISDNFESHIRARVAARAGLNHARALLKGICFDDFLQGPDGSHNINPAYIASARTYGYRNPVAWPAARMMDILDPSGALNGIPDDGVLNTGRHPGGNGVELVPLFGIAQMIPDPHGLGMVVASRYFVKVSDNNGEASEIAQDPVNDPFLDGDGQIIVRSMGIAQTLREEVQAGYHRNSIALLETRFKRFSTFDLEAALLVQGDMAVPASASMFDGNLFLVQGGAANHGIATIDTLAGSGNVTAQQILSQLTPAKAGRIQGIGPAPSLGDITRIVSAHPDKSLLLSKSAVWSFMKQTLPQFADSTYSGPQRWIGAAPNSLGSYNATLPQASPSQDPRVTYVDGDLVVDGNLQGGGILVVTGKLSVNGQFRFSGLILVIGAGELESGGWSLITGAVYVAGLSDSSGILNWGPAKLTLKESSQIIFDHDAVRMAVSLIPPIQLSFREITSIIDP